MSFFSIKHRDRELEVEVQMLAPERVGKPLLVFLHEGLGSVSMWRDFPTALCDALGWRGLVYSRPGYGQSTPRLADEVWGVDFMHTQARELLPLVLHQCGVDASQQPIWLLGHSDGGSIALLHAAMFPEQAAGVVVMAPHVFVEDVSVASIAATQALFEHGNLRATLARHHDSPESAFYGWFGAWMNPAFGAWNITDELARISCPVLAIQGVQDEYGTFDQIDAIKLVVPQTQAVKLDACGHSPHRDQLQKVIDAVKDWVRIGVA